MPRFSSRGGGGHISVITIRSGKGTERRRGKTGLWKHDEQNMIWQTVMSNNMNNSRGVHTSAIMHTYNQILYNN